MPPTHSAATILALAIAIDVGLGELPNRVHPVVAMGKLAEGLLRFEPARPLARLLFGGLLTLIVCTSATGAYCLLASFLQGVWRLGFDALVLSSTFSVRGLWRAGSEMQRALSCSIEQARQCLRNLCSRDARQLDEEQLIGATVESLIENTCDSFVAPLIYFYLLGPAGAVLYRSINTLDSMIGYRGRFEHTGKFAARLDDIVNFLPARVSVGALLLTAPVLRLAAWRGWTTALRDHAATESPNAGWTMACAAGCLGVRLEKPGHYALGDPLRPLTRDTIGVAQRMMLAVFVLVAGLVLLSTTLRGAQLG